VSRLSTFSRLVQRTRHRLAGFDGILDASTELSDDLTVDAVAVPVTDPQGFGRGVVEIDLEVVRIASADPESKILHAPTFGRGYRGTIPTTHGAGTEVVLNPLFPASDVADKINSVLRDIFPNVYAVKSVNFDVTSGFVSFALPVDTFGVIAVTARLAGSALDWRPVVRWEFDPNADTATHSTGRALHFPLGVPPGSVVRVTYAEAPGLFDVTGVPTQDFETVTGLPERCEELLEIGVASLLAPFVDMARSQVAGAEARAEGDAKKFGAANTVAQTLYSMYKTRVEAERALLAKQYPIRSHKVR